MLRAGRRLQAAVLASLFLLNTLSAIPVPAPAPGPEPFSCALRIAPDGSLYHGPVDFPLPLLPDGSAPVSLGRGTYSNIINNSGRAIPEETVRSLDENFTLYIYPNDTAAFGTPPYAKINIIIVSQDGVGGVAGYFSSGDPDAIYLDYDDLNLDLDVTAHEFQHLIHNYFDPWESTFVNEGCSETGIYVSYGGGRPGLNLHFQGFGANTDNSFVDWNTVSDYGGAGLYTIYCYEHFGCNTLSRTLVSDTAKGIDGWNRVLAPKGEDFTSVFKKWVVANWLNNRSVDQGQWGYRDVYNYVGHTFLVKNYPYTCSSQVDERWSADYIRFEPTVWNQVIGDLEVNVSFTSGTGHCAVAMVGKAGTGVADAVVVPVLSGGKATMVVPNLGGDYSVAGVAVSGLGGPAGYTFSVRVIDITPPTTTASPLPAVPNGKNGWYVTRPSITLKTNELNTSKYYRWGDGPELEYSQPFQAPEGDHELRFRSVDKYGNAEAPRSLKFRVDTAAPVTNVTLDPAQPDGQNGWYTSPPTVSLTPEPGSANLTFWWDEEAPAKYSAPSRAPEGLHRYNFRAEDQAGNLEQVKTAYIKVDSLLPVVEASLRPQAPEGQNGWYLKAPGITLHSNDSGEPVIRYRWDGGNDTPYDREIRAPAGAHVLTCHAVDSAGNRGPDSILVVKVDGTPPSVDAFTDPPVPNGLLGYYNTTALLTLTANETGTVTIFYRWDTGMASTYAGQMELPEGDHSITYHGVDEAGNIGRERTLNFKVDTIPPSADLDVGPQDRGNNWYQFRPQVILRTEDGATVQWSLDGGPWTRYIKPFEIGEGLHELRYFATDRAGNGAEVSTRKFRVDTTPPRLTFTLSAVNLTTKDELCVTASAEDPNGIQDLLFDLGDGTASGWVQQYNFTWRYPSPGTYNITVKARDRTGLITSAPAQMVTVKVPPPKPGPVSKSPLEALGDFLAGLPVAVYYLIALLVVAAVAGAAAGQVLKKKRRERLYIAVERAEADRERRHTMEIEETPADILGGFRGGGFGPPAPGYDQTPWSPPRAPGEVAAARPQGDGSSRQAPPRADAWTHPAPARAEPGMEKVLDWNPQREVVYQAEVGAPAPIWASRPAAPGDAPASAPAAAEARRPVTSPAPRGPPAGHGRSRYSRSPSPVAPREAPAPERAPAVPAGRAGQNAELDDLLKRIERVSK